MTNLDPRELSGGLFAEYHPVNNCLPLTGLYIIDRADSTNDILKAMDKESRTPVALMARQQTGGRGTRGRIFCSPKGGLYLSILIFPDAPAEKARLVTSYTAVAVRRAIARLCGKTVDIKWVNDLYYEGKKLCGILCESALTPKGKTDYTVVGIGVNILSENLPYEIADIATALDRLTDTPPTPEELCRAILSEFFKELSAFDSKGISDEYREASCLVGKKLITPDGEELICLGIDDERRITVRHKDGRAVSHISLDFKIINP